MKCLFFELRNEGIYNEVRMAYCENRWMKIDVATKIQFTISNRNRKLEIETKFKDENATDAYSN